MLKAVDARMIIISFKFFFIFYFTMIGLRPL